MNPFNTEGFFQSRTIKFIIGAGVAALIRLATLKFGIPFVPEDVQAEAVMAAIVGLEAIGLAALSLAARFRARARSIIQGWF